MIHGLSPIYDARTELLILGSAPSVQSLKQQEYYGNPSNQFWSLVFSALRIPDPVRYQERIRLLLAHKIGLWDVYGQFSREGSMDHRFIETSKNTFEEVLNQSSIHTFVANGKKAYNELLQVAHPLAITLRYCPSSSGANNAQMLKRKESWQLAIQDQSEALFFGRDSWLLAASYALRYEVFVREQCIPIQLEFDQKDEHAESFVLFIKNQPIGTMRFLLFDDKSAQIDRFCVTKSARKKGYGTKLIRAFEERSRQRGFDRIVLYAELAALRFYEKSGYTCISDIVIEDGIACKQMEKKL